LLRRYGHLDTCSLQSAQEVRWKISDTLMNWIWSRSGGWQNENSIHIGSANRKLYTHWSHGNLLQ
jgi:hypothetical protein